MRLLVVEDDPMIGEDLEEGLRQENYAVDWVRDGEAAVLVRPDGVVAWAGEGAADQAALTQAVLQWFGAA